MLAFELGKPPRKPRVLARTKSTSESETVAPSESVMRRSTASAAASRAARELDRVLHRKAPRMEQVEVRRLAAVEAVGLGQPAASSSAVWRAIAHAAATVRSMASGERSEVLALPRRRPKYTVIPMPLSRLYSTVSTSPRRTVTDCPSAAETSTSASLAPRACAASRLRSATPCMASRESGRAAGAIGWSGMGAPARGVGTGLDGAGRGTLDAAWHWPDEAWKKTISAARRGASGR